MPTLASSEEFGRELRREGFAVLKRLGWGAWGSAWSTSSPSRVLKVTANAGEAESAVWVLRTSIEERTGHRCLPKVFGVSERRVKGSRGFRYWVIEREALKDISELGQFGTRSYQDIPTAVAGLGQSSLVRMITALQCASCTERNPADVYHLALGAFRVLTLREAYDGLAGIGSSRHAADHVSAEVLGLWKRRTQLLASFGRYLAAHGRVLRDARPANWGLRSATPVLRDLGAIDRTDSYGR
jgi:hypothetical protein